MNWVQRNAALIAAFQGIHAAAMIMSKRKKRSTIVRTVRPERATKDVVAFKRAADSYVRKATASEKSANSAMVALGIQDRKGNLTKNYR